jgi:TRAP-type C4-dicarboxylate transport system substrate-binding protein
MSVLKKTGIILLFLLLAAGQVGAQQKITFKLASLAPENTPWGVALNRMAAEWSTITNGEVDVVIYHGGVAGDEAEVLRKLRLNQIQAAVLTSQGLKSVMPEALTLSYPMLIRNNAELGVVLARIRPELDAGIARNGFVTMAWTNVGWLQIFSRAPVFTPADMRRQRLGTNADDQQMLQAFSAMGFPMVTVDLNNVLVSLNAGQLDAVYWSPIFAASAQIFGVAGNMIDLNLAPFMGGILMNQTAWRRIPERYRSRLMESSKRIEREVDNSIARLEADAINTMVRHGLTINRPSPAQLQEWYDDMARHENRLTEIFDRTLYLRIKGILEEYRRGR